MKVGIVLAGGMAKGAYEIGALRAVGEYFPPEQIKYMSSASVGVLNGYAFKTGRLDAGEKMWRSVNPEGSRIVITSMLKSAFLQDSIRGICEKGDRIADPFYISLYRLRDHSISYTDLSKAEPESYLSYLRASVAMPVYNKPVEAEGSRYFDGAMLDNIPVHPLLRHSIDCLICIYFNDCDYIFENEYLNNKIIKINISDDKLISSSVFFNRESIDHMLKEGYRRAKEVLDFAFAAGTRDCEKVYRQIECMNRACKKRVPRITGDVVVQNLNRVAQKLVKKKIC